jgi:hypothetical protein
MPRRDSTRRRSRAATRRARGKHAVSMLGPSKTATGSVARPWGDNDGHRGNLPQAAIGHGREAGRRPGGTAFSGSPSKSAVRDHQVRRSQGIGGSGILCSRFIRRRRAKPLGSTSRFQAPGRADEGTMIPSTPNAAAAALTFMHAALGDPARIVLGRHSASGRMGPFSPNGRLVERAVHRPRITSEVIAPWMRGGLNRRLAAGYPESRLTEERPAVA